MCCFFQEGNQSLDLNSRMAVTTRITKTMSIHVYFLCHDCILGCGGRKSKGFLEGWPSPLEMIFDDDEGDIEQGFFFGGIFNR